MKLYVQRKRYLIRVLPTSVRSGDVLYTRDAVGDMSGPYRVYMDLIPTKTGLVISVCTPNETYMNFDVRLNR